MKIKEFYLENQKCIEIGQSVFRLSCPGYSNEVLAALLHNASKESIDPSESEQASPAETGGGQALRSSFHDYIHKNTARNFFGSSNSFHSTSLSLSPTRNTRSVGLLTPSHCQIHQRQGCISLIMCFKCFENIAHLFHADFFQVTSITEITQFTIRKNTLRKWWIWKVPVLSLFNAAH